MIFMLDHVQVETEKNGDKLKVDEKDEEAGKS